MKQHEIYEHNRAIGIPDIRNDSVIFRFKDELYEFPTSRMPNTEEFGGFMDTIDIKELRKYAQTN